MKGKKWYDYLWIGELCYLVLGLFNILFAWLGMLFFTIPLVIAIFGGSKAYCNRYCGRGQLLGILGKKLKLPRNQPPAPFSAQRLVPVRLSGLFHVHVRPDALRHLEGVYRCAPEQDGHPALGL